MEELFIYAAGLFDGEGYVAIRKTNPLKTPLKSPLPHYSMDVSVNMTDGSAIELLHKRWGGSLHIARHRGNPLHKPLVMWSISALKGSRFLSDILPYLVVKKDRVKLALEFQEHMTKSKRASRVNGRLPLKETVALRDSYHNRMKALNKRGL